jgi:hypothetical protein
MYRFNKWIIEQLNQELCEGRFMYYLVSFAIYFGVLYVLFLLIRRNFKSGDTKRFFKKLDYYAPEKNKKRRKGVSRRKRINELQISTKILFYLWLGSSLILWFGGWIISSYLQPYLQEKLFLPSSINLHFVQPGTVFMFFGANFFISTIIAGVYNNLLNRGRIRVADKVYNFGSFKEYPKVMNMIMSWIGVAISVPMVIFSLNCYFYFTNDYFVVKNMFSLSPKQYAFKEIKDVEISLYKEKGNWCYYYDINLKNGQSLDLTGRELLIYSNSKSNDEMVMDVDRILSENKINIRRPGLDNDEIKDIRENSSERDADFLVKIATK